jgi:hypothetical protein
MLLIFDAKCNLCRTLAYKIHTHSTPPVEIRALSDPEAIDLLDTFYPKGWSHAFYVIDNNICRKGVAGLLKLLRALGVKRLGAILSEYSFYKLRAYAVSNDARKGAVGESRRRMLKYAVLSPVMIGLSKRALADPFQSPPPNNGLSVHIAQINEGGEVTAWRCNTCILPAPAFSQGLATTTVQQGSRTILRQGAISLASNKQAGTLTIHKSTLTVDTVKKNGNIVTRNMDVYAALFNHPRFHISLNIGDGPIRKGSGVIQAQTLAVTISHDLPLTNIDFIGYETTSQYPYTEHLDAFARAINALGTLHSQEGTSSISTLYVDIEQGLNLLNAQLQNTIPSSFAPVHNKLVITSMPELMKFTKLPADVKLGGVRPAGCSCSVSCCCGSGVCCGCGCSIGICLPETVCGCCCGAGIGCSCGGCCGCDLCGSGSGS